MTTTPYGDLLDDEVRALFAADGPVKRSHTPFGLEPLLAQLIVELRKSRQALERIAPQVLP